MRDDEALYAFGPFVLDARERALRRGEELLRLTPREIDVLVALVERHGEIVEKSRFFDQVWRGLAVEDCNLSQHVAGLRRALGDDARVPTFIETLPRRGYRFVAPVSTLDRSPLPAPEPAGVPAPAPTPVPAPDPPAPRKLLRATARLALAALGAVAVLGVALGWRIAHVRASAPSLAGRAVVVQPFANLTGDAHHDALAETLTAELIKDLRGAEGLRVDAGSLPASERQVARADAIVETALLSADGTIRLTAELLEAGTRRLVWAEVFDAAPVSFLEAEDRVARAILDRLPELRRGPDAPPSPQRAEAQRECALAHEFLSRRSPHVVREALAHFEAAAERDGGYAPAHAGVAEAYLLGVEERVLPPEEALAGAEAAARRALAIDPRLAVAEAALGEVAAARWDFDAAEAGYRRALQLDASIASVHEKYADLLTVRDRHDQAVAEARVARDLAPSSPAAATALAAAYYHSGQADAAVEQALVALRLAPRFAAAYDVLGWAYQSQRRDAEAVAAFQEAVRLSGNSPTYVAALARAHARGGSRGEARRLLADLERRHPDRGASRLDVAEILAALGETDRALQQIERAVAEGTPWLQHVDAGLSLASLHDHARFRALVARMRRSAEDDADAPAAVPSPRPHAVAAPLSLTAPLGGGHDRL